LIYYHLLVSDTDEVSTSKSGGSPQQGGKKWLHTTYTGNFKWHAAWQKKKIM